MDNRDEKIIPALYVVATPIGNYGDITLRAIDVLKNVNTIVCEDTRVTAKLLDRLEVRKPLMVYNDHSDTHARAKIIGKIKAGESVAIVSDAGTPLISDPGYKLVRECKDNNVQVIAIPGASSVITALSISGLATDRFMFCGFLQSKSSARIKQLEEIRDLKATVVFFEAARRLIESLEDIKKTLGNRQIAVARELTKLYEEVQTDSTDNIIDYYTQNPPRGEIVLVIEGWNKDIEYTSSNIDVEIEQFIAENIKTLKPKKLAKELSIKFNLDSKDAYNRVMQFNAK